VWAGAESVAPGPLPKNTQDYIWLQFFLLAPLKDMGTQFAIAIVVSAYVVMWYYVLPNMKAYTMLTTIVAMAGLGYLFIGLVVFRRAATDVHVLRRIGGGLPVHDIQRWWRKDEIGWPDAWRKTMGAKRVLWIDALEYDGTAATLYPFNPDLAPLPINTSQMELGNVYAKRRAARAVLDARSAGSVALKQGAIALAIVVCVMATYLGGSQVVEQINGVVAEDIKAQIREDLLRELQPQPVAP
jgi:hypothetical protein